MKCAVDACGRTTGKKIEKETVVECMNKEKQAAWRKWIKDKNAEGREKYFAKILNIKFKEVGKGEGK